MTPLSHDEREQRLRYDFEVVGALRSPWLQLSGFASPADVLALRPPIAPRTPGAAPRHLLVRYAFPTLAGPGRWQDGALLRIDLVAGGDYPFTRPAVTVLPPIPWNHRVHPPTGMMCIGTEWEDSRGQILVAHLIVHLARILNFDEPHSGGDLGFQPEVARYWQTALGGRPLNPGLRYPALPLHLTHGIRTTCQSAGAR